MTDDRTLWRVYLTDHLTGAYAGVALARRIAGSHDDPALAQLAVDVAADRDALLGIIRGLGLRAARERQPVVRLGELAGRLKPNGSLTRRTELTDLVELELMAIAVTGKAAGWRTLRIAADHDERFDAQVLDGLIARADEQAALLEGLRRAAAERVAAASAPS